MGCGGSKSTETGSSTVLDKEKESENKTAKDDKKSTASENVRTEDDNKATKSIASETKTVTEVIKPNDSEVNCKIIIVGDERVGKTCLLTRFVLNEFIDMYLPTLGAESKSKVVKIDGKSVKLQVSDTSGNERFRQATSSSLKDADAVLLVFDVTSRASFNNVGFWNKMIMSHGAEKCVICLVGNKCDSPEREVTSEDAAGVAEMLGLEYAETSAKDNVNLEKPFLLVGKHML